MGLPRANVKAPRERLKTTAQEYKYSGADGGQRPAAGLPVSPAGEPPLSSPHFSRTEPWETDECPSHRPPGTANSYPEPEALRTYVMSRKKSVPSVSGMASAWQVTQLAGWSPRGP